MSTALAALQQHVEARVLGQPRLVARLLIGLLADGHVLVEGLPGLAKTRAIRALAGGMAAAFSRIQFTPDILPADVTGSDIFRQRDGAGTFEFVRGPVFANLVLADEINRAPAKVQSALLEAMEEHQVTVAGRTHALPDVFLVMATQNPIEHEGTYPLPEAQLDRFLLHVRLGYPDAATELQVLQLVRAEASGDATGAPPAIASLDDIRAARAAVRQIHASPALDRYLVDIVQATREPSRHGADLARWIEYGASPRGTLALDRAGRAHAYLSGRDFVTPEDIRAIAHDALRHRLVLSYEAEADGIEADQVIDEVLRRVTAL